MDSVEVNIFENPHYSFDPPTAPTESATNDKHTRQVIKH
jgi:hypothetical protein